MQEWVGGRGGEEKAIFSVNLKGKQISRIRVQRKESE